MSSNSSTIKFLIALIVLFPSSQSWSFGTRKVNEEFLRITAGDNNNIYNRSYYFKTTKGHFYMIEKNYIATMYNSYTKKEVSRLQMPMPKVNKLETSTFYKVLTKIDSTISTLFNFVPTTHTKMRPAL